MSVRIDEGCLYTESHEWLRIEGDTAQAGITDYAQNQLSDIVFVELPEVGEEFAQGDNFAVVESVKAASDCFLGLAGKVIEINETLEETPEAVNAEPYTDGWFVKLRIADPEQISGLMTPAKYAEFAAAAEEQGAH